MDVVELRLRDVELETQLLPRLRFNPFHVTTWSAAQAILESGRIESNIDGAFGSTFPQAVNSFFRRRGCVSVFDLRLVSDVDLSEALRKFYFLNPSFARNHPCFLLLDAACLADLVPWTAWREAGSPLSEVIIPHVEAGYPGAVEVAHLASMLRVCVDVTPPPAGSLVELIRGGAG